MSLKGLAAIAAFVIVSLGTSNASSSPIGTLTGAVALTDHTWICQGPVNLSSVTVTIRNVSSDAIHLGAGCTGTIGRVTVVQYHGDGIKVGPGAHDLSVAGGSIRCYARDPTKHQDGIQAMGGQRVSFHGLDDQCLSANNSALFINEGGAGQQLPTDIVCDGCNLAGGGYPVRIALSLRSGIRNSRVCAGHFGSVRVSPGIAQNPVVVSNVVSGFNPATRTCNGGLPLPSPSPSPKPKAPSTTRPGQPHRRAADTAKDSKSRDGGKKRRKRTG
jgi:hypothetical protein